MNKLPAKESVTPALPCTSKDKTCIKQVLEKHPFIRMAVLFGSLAKGNARSDSDLDLMDWPLIE